MKYEVAYFKQFIYVCFSKPAGPSFPTLLPNLNYNSLLG